MEDYLIQARAATGLTMANLFGGGGLCTLGGVRAGFNPIWSTEVVASKQLLLEHISSARCYGDTFGSEVWSAPTPNLMWVTAPCIDYSLSGPKDGGNGDTGWGASFAREWNGITFGIPAWGAALYVRGIFAGHFTITVAIDRAY